MRKDLMRGLKRLESRFQEVDEVVLVWVRHRIEDARRDALADNERIVCDLYRQTGQFGSARERITTDPADEGRQGGISKMSFESSTRIAEGVMTVAAGTVTVWSTCFHCPVPSTFRNRYP